jgi:hypothetical protein
MAVLLWSIASLIMASLAVFIGVAFVRTYRAGPTAIRNARINGGE